MTQDSLIWINPVFNQFTPAEIIKPLVGRFTGLVAWGGQKDMFALIDEADRHGLDVYLWPSPGRWYDSYPDNWNCIKYFPDYRYAWVAFHLEWVRQAALDRARQWITPYLGKVRGLSLDYIRYPSWMAHQHDAQSPDDVTEVVKLFRQFADLHQLRLIASVQSSTPRRHQDLTVPRYESIAQHWPDWLRQDLLDAAFVMSYRHRVEGDAMWRDLPADTRDRQRIILSPGGIGSIDDRTPPTAEQWAATLSDARLYGFPEPFSVFQWRDVNKADVWRRCAPLPQPPPDPGPRKYSVRFEGTVEVQEL